MPPYSTITRHPTRHSRNPTRNTSKFNHGYPGMYPTKYPRMYLTDYPRMYPMEYPINYHRSCSSVYSCPIMYLTEFPAIYHINYKNCSENYSISLHKHQLHLLQKFTLKVFQNCPPQGYKSFKLKNYYKNDIKLSCVPKSYISFVFLCKFEQICDHIS